MSVSDSRVNPVDDALALVHRTLLGEAIDQSSLLAFVADEGMRYAAVNATACEALGYSQSELQRLSVSDVVKELSAPADYADLVAKGQRSGTAELRTKDGRSLRFAYHSSETAVSGVQFYVSVGVIVDVNGVDAAARS
jgi:PAS domain S-box-containing protein